MEKQKTFENTMLNAYFTADSFIVDELHGTQSATLTQWYEQFKFNKYNALYRLGFLTNEKWFSSSIDFLFKLSERLIKRITQQADIETIRETINVKLSEDELNQFIDIIPFVIGSQFINHSWINKVWELLLNEFKSEIKVYDGTVANYFCEYNSNLNIVGKVFFHLVENNDEEYPFAFMATYTTKPVKSKKTIHTPIKNALKEFDGDEKKLLKLISTVIKVSEKSDFISDLLKSGELFSPIKLTKDEAFTILKEMPLYEETGILCRVPDWWRKNSNSIRLTVSIGDKEPAKVGLEALMDFSPNVMIGDEIIAESELLSLMEMAESLTLYKGKWVEINHHKLQLVLDALKKVKDFESNEGVSLKDAMRLELKLNQVVNKLDSEVDVSLTNGKWLRSIKDKLFHPETIKKIKVEPTFLAKLRHYQLDGYQWLNQMAQLGFGACLADDMGLGKTIQMIAYLEYQRTHKGGKVLLILPTSLLGNWQKEIEKFAPKLVYKILHKFDQKNVNTLEIEDTGFLFITTYGMAMRLESLKQNVWDCVILDEAQAIKNPNAKQTKAIKLIPAKMRIALTGTPIENRLSELWSLFDFLNQGLLGTPSEFKQFTNTLTENAIGYTKLRKVIQPFMLRRLKTDKTVINDLPDKLEMNAYASLTNKQIVLYKQLLEQITNKLDEVEGINRKGLVLASITKFKQICNHPDHYLSREEYKPEQSGKFDRLKELCETIYEKRERVIVFTQFREMTEPLSDFLSTIFQKKGLVLHGGTSIKKRTEMVEQFNSENYIPYMVLSLKAGGVGLNLVSANHVIHFDRWWNPAVENQATDRAFRIGQTKNVMVHKLVTVGTIEEKIDAIIQDKQKLSSDILSGTNEQWITEYSNAELLDLFALGGKL